MERGSQTRTLGTAQVAFNIERRLELEHLAAREHRARLFLARRFGVEVMWGVCVAVISREAGR